MADKIMIFDIETENHKHFGAVASPRHPDNFVVLNGWRIDGPDGAGPRQLYEASTHGDWLTIPDDVWLLVMHNAPFEMDWALAQQRPEIMKFLRRGGRIFCTAYAEYLLSNQLDTYPSLNETAPKYGGTPKVDGIKILWEQGWLTSAIDRELLKDYLIGDSGDVANTAHIFYGQVKALQERGMWNMALERMEGMLFCCFAMDAGLYVNRDVAFAQLEKQNADLAVLQASFRALRSNFPELVEFKESSDYHMSAWLYGGPIKYRQRVESFNDDGTPKYEKADYVTLDNGMKYVAEISDTGAITVGGRSPDLIEFDDGVNFVRYKSGKNKGEVKVTREDTDVIKLKWGEAFYQCPALVDLGLLPQDIYKEFVKTYAGKRTLSDDTPVYSSGADALEMLRLRPELPENVRAVLASLSEFAKLDKDIGTYYLREEKDDEGNVVKQSGMLQYLNNNNYVHHMLNMTSTVTGRLSSNRPNFQNLPRGGTSDVKKMFTSRFGSDGFIVEADYSALEVVALAAFSKDTALTKALVEGIDMHCMRLATQLKEPYEVVLDKCKNQAHPDFKRYDAMRTAIKPKAFSYQYGATAQGIAFATGCTIEEAQLFIDTEKALFPEVETFYADIITPVVEASGVLMREQSDDGSWRMYKRGVWQSPGGTCYSFRQFPKTQWVDGKRFESMEYKPTQIRNYPIQGESGFFVQGICGLIIRWLIAHNFFEGNVYVINTVHDAVYLDCHKSVLDVVCANVKRIMESLPQHFNERFGYTLDVPFPAAVEFGRSMHEKIHWHEGVLDDPKVKEKLNAV
jgi:hypothetical protein